MNEGIELDIGGLFSDLHDIEDDEFAKQEYDSLFGFNGDRLTSGPEQD